MVSFVVVALESVLAQEDYDPGEKILGFSLDNFNEQNKKTWDLKGDTLEIFGDIIEIAPVTANVYGQDDNMLLVADKGTFDRINGKVHLQDNVVITSDSGAKMMTDTLDWLQKNQLVTTEDKVNIYRDNIEAEGVGAVGKTDLKQFTLNKQVQVDINPKDSEDKMAKTTIICDGPLDIDYEKKTAVFNDNVEAYDGEKQLFADKMTGYFDKDTNKMIKVIAEGNVKIIRGKDIAYAKEAIYDAQNQIISLIGRPKLIIYSSKEEQDKSENQEAKQQSQEENKKEIDKDINKETE